MFGEFDAESNNMQQAIVRFSCVDLVMADRKFYLVCSKTKTPSCGSIPLRHVKLEIGFIPS